MEISFTELKRYANFVLFGQYNKFINFMAAYINSINPVKIITGHSIYRLLSKQLENHLIEPILFDTLGLSNFSDVFGTIHPTNADLYDSVLVLSEDDLHDFRYSDQLAKLFSMVSYLKLTIFLIVSTPSQLRPVLRFATTYIVLYNYKDLCRFYSTLGVYFYELPETNIIRYASNTCSENDIIIIDNITCEDNVFVYNNTNFYKDDEDLTDYSNIIIDL